MHIKYSIILKSFLVKQVYIQESVVLSSVYKLYYEKKYPFGICIHLNYRKIEILNFIYIQLRVYFVLYIISFLLNIKCIHRTRILYNIRSIYIVCVLCLTYICICAKKQELVLCYSKTLENFFWLYMQATAW